MRNLRRAREPYLQGKKAPPEPTSVPTSARVASVLVSPFRASGSCVLLRGVDPLQLFCSQVSLPATAPTPEQPTRRIVLYNSGSGAFVFTAAGHLLGHGEVALLGVRRVDQVHRLVCFARGDLDRYAVARPLIAAQVGLVERDAGRFGGGLEFVRYVGDGASE